ncbi:FecR family protein [Thalassobellus citreus]|uniref:FecR family protein n=1 Tax=Thalassobellus citreus TaxID=3367752 RepID=UPI0037AD113E
MEKLTIKLLTDTITEEELSVLQDLIKDKANKKRFENLLRANLYLDLNNNWNTENAFDKVLAKIAQEEKPVKKLIPSWIKYVAASVVILIASTLYFNNKLNIDSDTISETQNSTIIVAGTNKATLTLETGVDVALEKGKKYSNKNVESSGEALIYNNKPTAKEDIQYNYLTIARGGQFFLELSDGTKVWLNSESKLKYPVNFPKNKTREVELVYGEAYFEVSPSTQHNGSKFKVNNAFQNIEVLGTQFNVKAYKEDLVITTSLVEGKVKIENNFTGSMLKPGEASYVNIETKSLTVEKTDIESAIAWKNGYFMFKNETLEAMVITLSRWYNVDFSFENSAKKNLRFTGILNRSDNVNSLLQKIEKTDEASFVIENNNIIIK